MQANWSLILNVLLLIGVVIAIGRLIKSRSPRFNAPTYQPSLGQVESKQYDDIIAVRKISPTFAATNEEHIFSPVETSVSPVLEPEPQHEPSKPVMFFLLAKENRQLAGYELLQTVLAAGLRFGEGHLFHRHQHANGQGPVLCSLAAATATGVFDLQNIGAFSVRGLCLFMHSSGNSTIDSERFTIMLDTARQLSEGLNTYLLDEEQQPLTSEKLRHYYDALNINHSAELYALD